MKYIWVTFKPMLFLEVKEPNQIKHAMKKLLLSIALVGVFGIFAQAQPGGKADLSPEEKAVKQTERLAKELSLDAAQSEKLLMINKEFAAQMEAKRAEDKTDREARKKETMELRQQHNDQINSLLTQEQQKKYLEIQQGQQARKKDKVRARPEKAE